MLAYLFLALAVAVRFMPHPWTFTPVAAALLFFGARGSRRFLWVPLVVMAASDVVLTKAGLCLPVCLGPLRDLGVVCGGIVAGNPAAGEREASAGDWRGPGQFGFLLRDQQFCRVGGV